MHAIRPASVADLDGLSQLLDAYRRFYDQPGNVPAARDFLAAPGTERLPAAGS